MRNVEAQIGSFLAAEVCELIDEAADPAADLQEVGRRSESTVTKESELHLARGPRFVAADGMDRGIWEGQVRRGVHGGQSGKVAPGCQPTLAEGSVKILGSA